LAALTLVLGAKGVHSLILLNRTIQQAMHSPMASDGGGGSGGSTQRPKREPKNGWTNKLARQKARILGFNETKGAPFDSHGQPTFKFGNKWIAPDIDGHSGHQTWKMFDAAGNRLGTYNTDLTVRLGEW
jgi:hypothetical protein